MSRNIERDRGCAWRVEFTRPAIAEDDPCVMLYGPEGEIVGPLTIQLAEAWIDHFDQSRYEELLRGQEASGFATAVFR
jgi:hypothetical protein